MRNVYLNTVTLDEAIRIVTEKTPLIRKIEYCPLGLSLGKETALPIVANLSNPNYNAAAMDGIAVIAEKTHGASDTTPIRLELGSDFVWVNTGHQIVPPFNAVIMVEDLEADGDYQRIRQAAYPWQHVRMVGEDIAIGDMIMPQGKRIGPLEMGALASAGILEVPVYKAFTIAVVPTGSEIVSRPEAMQAGNIMESNSYMFKGLIESAGHLVEVLPVVKDVKALLAKAIQEACEKADLVIVNAGSSAGSEDFTREILDHLGIVHFHGIDIKPGKPTIFATVGGKPVFGIPGYPVSAFIAVNSLIMPLLAPQTKRHYKAVLSKPLMSSLKHEEYVRVQVGKIDTRLIATPLSRGAGATMSLVKANGLVKIPRFVEGYPAGFTVEVIPLNQRQPFEQALISIGSHDFIMDVLENLANPEMLLLSSHVGSLGGLLALKRGECHIAPTHLLEEDGTYNTSYVRRYFPENEMVLIKGIKRFQGFYLRGDTCRGLVDLGYLKSLDTNGFEYQTTGSSSDLLAYLAENFKFVNRQKGSGTRLLFDAMLKNCQELKESIEGYSLEVLTHTAVALAVQNGTADFGLGIAAAAERMGLCFVSLCTEDYDFLTDSSFLTTPMGVNFVDLLKGDAFARTIGSLRGYTLEPIALQIVGCHDE